MLSDADFLWNRKISDLLLPTASRSSPDPLSSQLPRRIPQKHDWVNHGTQAEYALSDYLSAHNILAMHRLFLHTMSDRHYRTTCNVRSVHYYATWTAHRFSTHSIRSEERRVGKE